MSEAWSLAEVEAIVAEYFAMLDLELRGQPFNKAERNRAIRRLLRNRPHGSVERKHQNISAILRDLDHPWIDGYKPLGNYQRLLWDVVVDRLERDQAMAEAIRETVTATVSAGEVVAFADVEEPPPEGGGRKPQGKEDRTAFTARRPTRRVDYLRLEAQNRDVGLSGEQWVVRLEIRRLRDAGAKRLADKVEHVSATRGDGLGYDVLSFDEDGRERFIEVKTTSFGKRTQFYVTRNEVDISRVLDLQYYLYRVFDFRRNARLFRLAGALTRTCDLDPEVYRGRVA